MNDVTHIAAKVDDNRLWSIADMLEQVAREIREGRLDMNPNRCLVLLADDGERHYHSAWRAANINCSQIITLCEMGKAMALEELGY